MIKIKTFLILSIISIIFFISCENNSLAISETESIAVQAYLYANERIDDIRINSTVTLDVDTNYAPPINDAEVILIKNDIEYSLESSAGDSGYYHYSGDDLKVETGDNFILKINYKDHEIYAETTVPIPSTNIVLSNTILEVPDFENAGFSEIREWKKNSESSNIDITWKNDNATWFYIILENTEENPEEIETMFGDKMRKRIFPPISDLKFQIRQQSITHLGRHRIKVYTVNNEYADLYSSRNQDSRDLQEPLTNIEGGLGVFTAFSCDSAIFTVIKGN